MKELLFTSPASVKNASPAPSCFQAGLRSKKVETRNVGTISREQQPSGNQQVHWVQSTGWILQPSRCHWSRWDSDQEGSITRAMHWAPADVSESSRHLTPPRTGPWEWLPEGNYLENRSCAVKCSMEAKRTEQCVLQDVSSLVQYPQATSLFTLLALSSHCLICYDVGTELSPVGQQSWNKTVNVLWFSFLTEFPNSQPA